MRAGTNIKPRLLGTACIVLAMVYQAQAQGSVDLVLPDIDVVKVDTTLVTINVSVTDTRNRHLQGLKLEDFKVTDEGKTVRPEFFDSEGPESIVFVIDVSSSMKGDKWQHLTAGLKKFLKKGAGGNDYTLIAFNEQPRLIVSTVNSEQLWQSFKSLRPDGETALYDALLLGLETLERVPQRHKALVLLSDGEDNSSRAGLTRVEQETLAHRATIYPLGILDQTGSPYQEGGKKLLKDLATATGGFVLFPEAQQIGAVLERISADLSGQYSLSYYPPEKTTGWRRVQVSVSQNSNHLNLRYQQRYLMR
jgi:Mg-chelatase subunit ChlD